MSPNRAFDRSLAVIRTHDDVKRRFGEPLKAYGRDHGGHREGRRNFVEHTEYTDQEDGSTRVRVRYNLSGQHGTAFVFAEVSSSMASGEFVYILVQDKSNGRVFTVVDNRSALTTQRLAGGNQEAQSAMSQLLSGNSK
jgi:import inner membrane translocase subunit TIM21